MEKSFSNPFCTVPPFNRFGETLKFHLTTRDNLCSMFDLVIKFFSMEILKLILEKGFFVVVVCVVFMIMIEA